MGVTYVDAADKHRARLCGPWTLEKLTYLRKYANAFMTAMAPKRAQGKWESLVFIDLLAGPGLTIDRHTQKEFPGSALIALNTMPRFDRLYLGDLLKTNVAALRARLGDEAARVDIKAADCNIRVHEVVQQVSSRALGLAFVDPAGFEVHFSTLRALAQRQIDVLLLFPSGIGIARNLQQFARETHSAMDDFWGGRQWRELPIARAAAGGKVNPEELSASLDHSWVAAFRKRMTEIGFACQDHSAPSFCNERNVAMYHLLFFSHHPIGLRIWRRIKQIEPTGQRGLQFGDA